jgi:hypothetical protein
MRLSKAIETLELFAEANKNLAAEALPREEMLRYLGTANGFRKAIEILRQVTELDAPTDASKGGAKFPSTVTLTMNGRRVYVDNHMTLTHEAVCVLALGSDYLRDALYTITGRHDGRGFGMVPNDEVDALDGMIFNVAYTGNA